MSGVPCLDNTKTQALPLAGWTSACTLVRDGTGLAFPFSPLGDVEIRPCSKPRFVLDPACLLAWIREGRAEEALCRRLFALISTEQDSPTFRWVGLPTLALLPLVNMSFSPFSSSSAL